jgi:hypothetical protein
MVDPWQLGPLVVQTMALGDANDRTLLSRLPPTQRAKLLMALLGLVLIGLALLALVAIAARWYRRTNKSGLSVRDAQPPDAWAQKPLNSDRTSDETGDDHSQRDDE